MWSSYEALCELGAVDIDPTSIFGVRPVEIDRMQEHMQKPQTTMPLQEKSVSSPSFGFSHHQTTPLQPMEIGTPSSSGSIPKASLFQTAQKSRGVTPNQLQFETPNLTPIPRNNDASFTAQVSSFLDSNNPNTIRRAKHVAAGLYYQPTPETPDSAKTGSSRYLRGRSALFPASSTVADTPLRRGGRQSELSTARKPRALFLSENKANNTKPQDHSEDFDNSRRDEEPHSNEGSNEKPVSEAPGSVNEKASNSIIDNNTNEEEENAMMDRHSHVQDILELFCLLGAGYWRLCQVRTFSL